MHAGARLYYTGDKREKRQEFKNQVSLDEYPDLTQKAMVKDLAETIGADGRCRWEVPFVRGRTGE